MYRHNYNPPSKYSARERVGGAEMSSSFHSGYGGGALSSSRLPAGYRNDPRYSSSDRLLSLYRTSALPPIGGSSRTGPVSSYRYAGSGSDIGLIRRSTSYSSGLGSLLAEEGRTTGRLSGFDSLNRNNGARNKVDTSRSYRSKTPPSLMSQLPTPIAHHQRESRSLGRDEGGLAAGAEEDNVEKTFEKLYKKYVVDSPVQRPNSSSDVAAAEEGSPEKKDDEEQDGRRTKSPSVQRTSAENGIPVVVEAREVKAPASQIEKFLKLENFDQESFKETLKRTLEKGIAQQQGDATRYRALSASPGRSVANAGTMGATNSDNPATTGNNQLSPAAKQKSKSESPAPTMLRDGGKPERNSPTEDSTQSRSPNQAGSTESREANSGRSRSNTRSGSRGSEEKKAVDEGNSSATSKRAQRMERTLENLVEKLGSAQKERALAIDGTDSRDRDQKLKPPLLLVTQPSIPNTPVTTATNVVWHKKAGEAHGNDEDADSGEEEEEDYSDEDEEYSDEEGDFESDWDMDSSVCKTLSISQLEELSGENGQTDNLSPAKGRMRSVTPDFEFELPFLQCDESRNDSRGRCSSADALPPPIFVASVSWDGADSWDSANEDSPAEDDPNMLDVDDVDVGCTLTLVERAAMRGSDDEDYTSSEYWSSSGEDESYSNSDEDSTVDEEHGESQSHAASSRSRTASSAVLIEPESAHEVEVSKTGSLSPTPCGTADEEGRPRVVERETKSLSPPLIQVVPIAEVVMQAPVDSLVDEVEMEAEELVAEEGSPVEMVPTVKDVDLPFESKHIDRTETYAKPQSATEKVEKADHLAQEQMPRSDFAKKAVIQPMRTEKIAVSTPPQPQVKAVEKKVEKKTGTSTVPDKMLAVDKSMGAPLVPKAPEDKSSMRKSTLNMADNEARLQLEQEQKERLKTRGTGTVTAMMEKFKPEPPKQEPITYKRSAMLEPKLDESRTKKVYQPIAKPAPNDEFEKQMAELRAQMKTKSTTLQAQYSNVRHGILSQADEVKLKAMKEKHTSKLGTVSNIFSRADDEKKRWKELHESEAEKKKREAAEKSALKPKKLEEEDKLLKQQLAPVEPKRTVRRVKKSEIEAPQSVSTTADGSVPPATATLTAGKMVSGSGVKERKESESSSTAVSSMAEKRLKKAYATRRKTDELMNFGESAVAAQVSEPSPLPTVVEGQQSKELGLVASRTRKRKQKRRHPNRRSHCHFVREPFDVDSLLGLSPFDTFEKMDAFFLKSGAETVESNAGRREAKRMRLIEHQKIWISELKDIDKLYKASELRDIKLTVEA